MAQFLCFGEMLLRLGSPDNKRLFQSEHLTTDFVGAEANVANLLARLGNHSEMFTVLPDNAVGSACRSSLMQHGTQVQNIIYTDGRLGLYFFERGAMMRPSSIIYDRRNSALAAYNFADIDWESLIQGRDWLHICGITLAISETAANAALAAAQAARESQVKISFDCNYRASLWAGQEDIMAKRMRKMAGFADCLFAGSRDARYFLDLHLSHYDPEKGFCIAAEEYKKAWPNIQHVASTHREVLSTDHNVLTGLYHHNGHCHTSRPYDLQAIVDRIGGGDAFAGGLLHKIGQASHPQEIIDFATASAAVKHAIAGDCNITNAKEIQSLIDSKAGDVSR